MDNRLLNVSIDNYENKLLSSLIIGKKLSGKVINLNDSFGFTIKLRNMKEDDFVAKGQSFKYEGGVLPCFENAVQSPENGIIIFDSNGSASISING